MKMLGAGCAVWLSSAVWVFIRPRLEAAADQANVVYAAIIVVQTPLWLTLKRDCFRSIGST
jgi:hypothetical protein